MSILDRDHALRTKFSELESMHIARWVIDQENTKINGMCAKVEDTDLDMNEKTYILGLLEERQKEILSKRDEQSQTIHTAIMEIAAIARGMPSLEQTAEVMQAYAEWFYNQKEGEKARPLARGDRMMHVIEREEREARNQKIRETDYHIGDDDEVPF